MSLSYYFNTEVRTVIRTERIAEHLVGKKQSKSLQEQQYTIIMATRQGDAQQ